MEIGSGIAKSGWRKNSEGGLTWTYGNYGGPGWSGGEFVKPTETPKWSVKPVDYLDAIFKEHDEAYQAAQDAFDKSSRTIADQQKLASDILHADASMVVAIQSFLLPWYPKTPEAEAAAEEARAAFLPKIIYDIGKIGINSPGQEGIYGDPFTGMPWPGIDPTANTATTNALNWVPPRRDPLVLDLDGGGIKTSGINTTAPILFDQDGDGTKTATGWIASGEAIVVRDLNGNGTIDSGRELFGDNTLLTHGPKAGQTAANGFEALADLDSNGDGKFDANDEAFASVKLWKDLNQDGVSQADELFIFDQLGVAGINVSGTAGNVNLGGGNTQTFSGSFTRADGTNGDSGTAQLAGSLLLSNNNFYRQFTDDPALTAQALALPEMHGSGLVRDMRAAMSLGTPQAAVLQSAVSQFAQGTTRDQQLALLDELIQSWGSTSAMQTSVAIDKTQNQYSTHTVIEEFAQRNPDIYRKITALEQFNGNTVLNHWIRGFSSNVWVVDHWVSSTSWGVSYSTEQEAFINQAYDALKQSVYAALVVQTRLKPYLDAISLNIDESGVSFDLTAAVALVQQTASANPCNAVADLLDLQKFANNTIQSINWNIHETLATLLSQTPMSDELQDLLTTEHIASLGSNGTQLTAADASGWKLMGNQLDNTFVGGGGADVLVGLGGNDTLYAIGNGDSLDGGEGDDTLTAGADGTAWYYNSCINFRGGTGNDTMVGSRWSDTYNFERGDGQDTIADDSGGFGNTDVIKFGAGIVPSDVIPLRSGVDLIFKLANGTDQITVKNWFADGYGYRQIEQIQFADGTTWTNAQATALSALPHIRIVGDAQQNQTLTLSNSFSGNGTVFGYQWQTSTDGRTWVNIDGANANTYTLTEAQVGLGVRVLATYVDGNGASQSVGSRPTDSIANVNDAPTGVVTFSGSTMQNQTLSASNTLADQDGMGAVSYQWQTSLDGHAWSSVSGATAATFTLGDAQVGGKVRVLASYTDGHGANESVTSAASTAVVGVVTNHAPTLVGQVANQTTRDFQPFALQLSKSQFADVDAGDTLAYRLALADGSALPAWLRFDASTLRLSGTPQSADVTTLALAFTATDSTGSSATHAFSIEVQPLPLVQGTMGSDTLTGGNGGVRILGGAGYDTLTGGTGNDKLYGEADNDTLYGGAGDDLLDGGAGVDYLNGGDGADLLLGGADNDTLRGGAGDDRLEGGEGYDTLYGDAGNDTLVGGTLNSTLNGGDGNDILIGQSGIDTLNGDAGDDTLDGGAGCDNMAGGTGNDTYYVDYQWETVTEAANAGTDTVISTTTFTLGSNLENLTLAGSGAINGTGNALANVLIGNAAANTLSGGAGNDTLDGQAGADVLNGGTGNDSYLFGRGDGADTVQDVDATAGNTDVLQLGPDVAANQLWFSRNGNHLDISIIGSADKVTVNNWYLGSQYHVEQIRTADGHTLLDSQVQSLVSAMAAFSPPPAGQSILSANYDALTPVIAANWS